jgi:alpha-L-fucosidase 2
MAEYKSVTEAGLHIRANGSILLAILLRVIAIAAVGLFAKPAAAEEVGDSAYQSIFARPPMPLPVYEQLDAPLMGNGDMAAALCGEPEHQQFWLSKNDLWELRPVWRMSGPRPFGHLDIDIPELADSFYDVVQNLGDATTVATFRSGPSTVTMRSWVSASENLLLVELSVEGAAVEGDARLWVPADARRTPQSDHRPRHGTADDWIGAPAAAVLSDIAGTYWSTRAFTNDVEVPAAVACAFRLLGGQGMHFTLRAGDPVFLAAAMRSLRQSKSYISDATRRVGSLNSDDLKALYAAHQKWWRAFWDKSSVELGDRVLNWRYNVSNYILASCSRDPEYPPGIAGTWVTTDQPMWTGAYTLNYNHEACFYGLYSSNHIEQADPEDAPVLDFMKRGEFYASAVLHCRGVLYPVKIGPVGVETTRDSVHPDFVTTETDPPWLRQDGGLFLGQKSDASFAAVNIAQRWYTTYDRDYAQKVYPFVRAIARFWEDYLKFEPTPPELVKASANLPEGLRQPAGGRYVDYDDGANEGGQDTNPAVSLSLIRNVLPLAIDLATELNQDK